MTGLVEIGWTGWPHGVTEAVLQAGEALARADAGTHVTFVVAEPPADPAHRGCLLEALRGLVHSSVLENPKVRANLVLGGGDEDRAATVHYLESAGFVFGATMDLGRAAEAGARP